MERSLLILTILIFGVQATEVNECSNRTFPLDVRVKGCNKSPCKLIRGSNLEFEIDFAIENYTRKLTTNLVATINNSTNKVPLLPFQSNTCRHLLNKKCPLQRSNKITYKFQMPILKSYPAINLGAELSVVDENNKEIFCFNCALSVLR